MTSIESQQLEFFMVVYLLIKSVSELGVISLKKQEQNLSKVFWIKYSFSAIKKIGWFGHLLSTTPVELGIFCSLLLHAAAAN